jgi:NAD(P)-dependent dehydrogenase (short-subunit alcohol dehydrogenase family)
MARVFITGSADGLGQLAAKALIEMGHVVMLHARNQQRAEHALKLVPGAEGVLIADLSSIKETISLAENANDTGHFDAVIHNAGVYRVSRESVGAEGLSQLFTVNSLAPYLLTCLMHKPGRLIYLSSGMHQQGDASLQFINDPELNTRRINYSDTKLHDLILGMAVARKWPDVYSNTINPGWVPTKMGGAGAPDDLHKGYETQVWLAVSNDREAHVSGQYFHHRRPARFLQAAKDTDVQERLLASFAQITDVQLREWLVFRWRTGIVQRIGRIWFLIFIKNLFSFKKER